MGTAGDIVRQRESGWEMRLAQLVEDARYRPFVWGVHDCGTFASLAIRALRGTGPRAEWGSSALSAARFIRAHGGTMESAVDHVLTRFGLVAIEPNSAQRGDIALVHDLRGGALGVILGAQVAAPDTSGLVFVPLAGALRAWAV